MMAISPGVELRFSYRAARPDGSVERGVLTAASIDVARSALHARGLIPVSLAAATRRGGESRVSGRERAIFLRMLAELLASGLPISRALSLLEESSSPRWRARVALVRERVRDGRDFAESLATADEGLPRAIAGLLRAGERGGGLPAAAMSAAEILEEQERMRSALLAAISYPILLVCAGAASVGLLVGVVLPRFAELLTDIGQTLPPTTAALLRLADSARQAGPFVLPASAVLLALAWVWASTASGRLRLHELLLGVPALGQVRHQNATAASCSVLGGLLEAGVPLPSATALSAEACGDAAVQARLLRVRDRVLAGARLASALHDERAVTTVALRLVSAGEQSGRLAIMAHHAARIERSQALERTRSTVRFIEPVLVLMIGGFVAFVAAALLQAVYAIRPQ